MRRLTLTMLALTLAGCAGLPQISAPAGQPTVVVTGAPTATAAATASPEPGATAEATVATSAPTAEAAAATAAPTATAAASPVPSPTVEPTVTVVPTEPLYLQPTLPPGAPTPEPPTATATATPPVSATPADATAAPTATLPPVPIISALRGRVANAGNVRADPNVRATAIDRLVTGEEVQLLGRSDNGRWYLVLTPRAVAGWVSATLLTVDPETAAQVPLDPDITLPTTPPTATVAPSGTTGATATRTPVP